MSTAIKEPKAMFRKYYDAWAPHAAKYGPRTALLYQVGGFFEIYDTENLTTGVTKANIREIAIIIGLNFVVGFILGGVDWRAHLGGLLGGALTAQLILVRRR
jgi:membrane associated rhomboid family serine protease